MNYFGVASDGLDLEQIIDALLKLCVFIPGPNGPDHPGCRGERSDSSEWFALTMVMYAGRSEAYVRDLAKTLRDGTWYPDLDSIPECLVVCVSDDEVQALIDLLHSLNVLPSFAFVDRITDPRPDPVDVDLVLDLGNSRTCGLLIESEPDQPSVDVNKAFRLQLRDLSKPEQVYGEPFASRFAAAQAAAPFVHPKLSSIEAKVDADVKGTVRKIERRVVDPRNSDA